MKKNKKTYSITVPIDLSNRLSFIKKLRKGKIDMGSEISKKIYPLVEEIEKNIGITKDTWKESKKCPKCDSYLVIRNSKDNKFYGCYNFPKCKHTESIK